MGYSGWSVIDKKMKIYFCYFIRVTANIWLSKMARPEKFTPSFGPRFTDKLTSAD
jgi:hypothetical protein